MCFDIGPEGVGSAPVVQHRSQKTVGFRKPIPDIFPSHIVFKCAAIGRVDPSLFGASGAPLSDRRPRCHILQTAEACKILPLGQF